MQPAYNNGLLQQVQSYITLEGLMTGKHAAESHFQHGAVFTLKQARYILTTTAQWLLLAEQTTRSNNRDKNKYITRGCCCWWRRSGLLKNCRRRQIWMELLSTPHIVYKRKCNDIIYILVKDTWWSMSIDRPLASPVGTWDLDREQDEMCLCLMSCGSHNLAYI